MSRFTAPSHTAGDVGILKHASNAPGVSLVNEDVFCEARCPEGVFQTALAPSDLVDEMIEDEHVRAATLTGLEPAGRAVAATAGQYLKTTVMELGELDPFVVLDDTGVAAALRRVCGRGI